MNLEHLVTFNDLLSQRLKQNALVFEGQIHFYLKLKNCLLRTLVKYTRFAPAEFFNDLIIYVNYFR